MDPIRQNEKSLTAKLRKLYIPILMVVVIIGILAAGMRAAYEDRVLRAQMSQAIYTGKSVFTGFADYYYIHNAFPDDLAKTEFKQTPNKVVQKTIIDKKTGMVSVILELPPYQGKAITFVPTVHADKSITWRCSSAEIPAGVLGPECR